MCRRPRSLRACCEIQVTINLWTPQADLDSIRLVQSPANTSTSTHLTSVMASTNSHILQDLAAYRLSPITYPKPVNPDL